MPNTYFATDCTIAGNMDRRTTSPEFALGETIDGNAGTVHVYTQASGVVATGTCTVDTTTFLLTDTGGNYTADVAFADGEYGWVRRIAGKIT